MQSSSESLRDRKKRRTRERIHKEALRLFDRRGFAATTIAEIAAAADVSPRTVFVHYPSKEDLVFGDVDVALLALEAALGARDPGTTVLHVLRAWLSGAGSGWLEPDLVLQVRLAHEIPSVAARKVFVAQRFREPLARAIAADLGATPDDLRVQLGAAVVIAGLLDVEALVSEHVRTSGRLPPRGRLEQVLDEVDRFMHAGLDAVAARDR